MATNDYEGTNAITLQGGIGQNIGAGQNTIQLGAPNQAPLDPAIGNMSGGSAFGGGFTFAQPPLLTIGGGIMSGPTTPTVYPPTTTAEIPGSTGTTGTTGGTGTSQAGSQLPSQLNSALMAALTGSSIPGPPGLPQAPQPIYPSATPMNPLQNPNAPTFSGAQPASSPFQAPTGGGGAGMSPMMLGGPQPGQGQGPGVQGGGAGSPGSGGGSAAAPMLQGRVSQQQGGGAAPPPAMQRAMQALQQGTNLRGGKVGNAGMPNDATAQGANAAGFGMEESPIGNENVNPDAMNRLNPPGVLNGEPGEQPQGSGQNPYEAPQFGGDNGSLDHVAEQLHNHVVSEAAGLGPRAAKIAKDLVTNQDTAQAAVHKQYQPYIDSAAAKVNYWSIRASKDADNAQKFASGNLSPQEWNQINQAAEAYANRMSADAGFPQAPQQRQSLGQSLGFRPRAGLMPRDYGAENFERMRFEHQKMQEQQRERLKNQFVQQVFHGPQQDFNMSKGMLAESKGELNNLIREQNRAGKEARITVAQQARQQLEALRLDNQALGRINSAVSGEQGNKRKEENIAIGQSNARSHAVSAGAAAKNAATSARREDRAATDDQYSPPELDKKTGKMVQKPTLGAQKAQAQIDNTKARTDAAAAKAKGAGAPKPPTIKEHIAADKEIDRLLEKGGSMEQMLDVAKGGGLLPKNFSNQRYRDLARTLKESDNPDEVAGKYRNAGIDPDLLSKINDEKESTFKMVQPMLEYAEPQHARTVEDVNQDISDLQKEQAEQDKPLLDPTNIFGRGKTEDEWDKDYERAKKMKALFEEREHIMTQAKMSKQFAKK